MDIQVSETGIPESVICGSLGLCGPVSPTLSPAALSEALHRIPGFPKVDVRRLGVRISRRLGGLYRGSLDSSEVFLARRPLKNNLDLTILATMASDPKVKDQKPVYNDPCYGPTLQ